MTDDNQTQFDSQETDIMQDEYSQYTQYSGHSTQSTDTDIVHDITFTILTYFFFS